MHALIKVMRSTVKDEFIPLYGKFVGKSGLKMHRSYTNAVNLISLLSFKNKSVMSFMAFVETYLNENFQFTGRKCNGPSSEHSLLYPRLIQQNWPEIHVV